MSCKCGDCEWCDLSLEEQQEYINNQYREEFERAENNRMKAGSVIFQTSLENDIQAEMKRTGKSYEECKSIVMSSL